MPAAEELRRRSLAAAEGVGRAALAVLRPVRRALRPVGLLFESPLLVRELRQLCRGRKFFLSYTFALAAIAALMLIIAGVQIAAGDDPAKIGGHIFGLFTMVTMLAVVLLAPAFSCTSITSERERKTYDLLVTTTIEPWQIIWGKMLSAAVVIGLFLVATWPLVSVSFMFGGVSPGEIALAYVTAVVGTLVCTALSLAVSAVARDSRVAIVSAYVAVLILAGVAFGATLRAQSLTWGSGLSLLHRLGQFAWHEQVVIVALPLYLLAVVFVFSILVAVNRLKPETWNRSTNLRLAFVAFVVAGLALWAFAAGHAAKGVAIDRTACGLMLPAWVVLYAGVLLFACEPVRAPARVERAFARKGRLARAFQAACFPGAVRGVRFLVLVSVLVLAGLLVPPLVNGAAGGAAYEAALLACGAFVFTLAFACLGLLVSSFGLRRRAVVAANGAAAVLLGVGPWLHAIWQSTSLDEVRNGFFSLHYASPFLAAESLFESGEAHTFAAVGLKGVPLWAGLIVFYSVAVLVLGAWAARRVRDRWPLPAAAAAAPPEERSGEG